MTAQFRDRRGVMACGLFAVTLSLAIGGQARGQTWNNVTGNWSSAANWTGGVPASGTTTVLNFGGSGSSSYTSTNTIGSPFPFVVRTFFLNSSSSATNVIAGTQIQLQGTSAGITNSGTGAFDVQAGLNLINAQTEFQPNSTLTVSGQINGTGGLLVFGGGTLFLNQQNNFSGGTTINNATVRASRDDAFGASTNTTTVSSVAAGAVELVGSVNQTSKLRLDRATSTGTGALRSVSGANSWSGAITLGANTSIGVDAGSTLDIRGGLGQSGTGR